jgi:transcriptional regulator with XRE-family HTH domain
MQDDSKPTAKRKSPDKRHPMAIAFGLYLKAVRKERDLSQAEAAFDSGLDRTYWSLLERGLSAPSLLVMDALSKALDMTMTELIIGFEASQAKSDSDVQLVPRRQNEASLAAKEQGKDRPQGSRRSPLR